MKTACGDDSHLTSALYHGLFVALYCGALWFHARSVLTHWKRHLKETP